MLFSISFKVRTKLVKTKIEISRHILVPKHVKLSDKEKKEVLEKFNSTLRELPKIFKDDPAVINLNAVPGDVIKIMRQSPTSGDAVFYRVVLNE